jgi:hypothetical protein
LSVPKRTKAAANVVEVAAGTEPVHEESTVSGGGGGGINNAG